VLNFVRYFWHTLKPPSRDLIEGWPRLNEPIEPMDGALSVYRPAKKSVCTNWTSGTLTLAMIANIAKSTTQSRPKLIPSDGSSFASRMTVRTTGLSRLYLSNEPTTNHTMVATMTFAVKTSGSKTVSPSWPNSRISGRLI
jgi:hypothetical protein